MKEVKVKSFKVVSSVINAKTKLHIETGIIKDADHFPPKYREYRNVAGVQVRRRNKQRKPYSLLNIARSVDKKFAFLSNPHGLKNSSTLKRIVQDLVGSFIFDGSKKNSVLNGSNALVRQPMLQGKYSNSPKTTKAKGFNRGTVDTGQLAESIDSVIVKDGKIFRR